MIENERIETIKATVDLPALVRAKGITLKKNGKGYMGLCPFHDDHTPSLSVNPTTNLWKCFGCNTGGDVIRFVELFDKVDFKTAIEQLSGNGFKKTTTRTPTPQNILSVKDRKLLAHVVTYYQKTLTDDDRRGLKYLNQDRGLTDNQTLKSYGAGYVNGTLLEILPQDPEVTEALKRIGILNNNGHEAFYNCVVFPLYNDQGSIVNLYGRNIDPAPSDSARTGVTHLYLPGPRRGTRRRQ